jgi:cell growth-regulating nucleolar protein
MVFFSCDGCGDAMKKNQVDGHAARCRRCASVSCADCLISFYGDDYRAHTSCLTEVERYETRGVAESKKGGKVSPQELWMNLIVSSVETAPGPLKHHLQVISGLDNVPRKEKQFRNFASNSLNLKGKQGEASVGEIWKYLKGLREEQQKAKQQKDEAIAAAKLKNAEATSTKELDELPNDGRHVDAVSASGLNDISPPNPKIVKKAIKKVLKKASGHKLSLKRLRKEIQLHLGASKSDKKRLKVLVQQTLESSTAKGIFLVSGDNVQLQVD